VRTDLDRFTAAEFEVLVNHGYFSCEAGLVADGVGDADAPAAAWPYPSGRRRRACAAPCATAIVASCTRVWWQN
jgi:hypothetical protein